MAEAVPLWSRAALERALAPHGLRLRGGFVPEAEDQLPGLAGGRQAAVVWMVGQAGGECWVHFAASPFFHDGLADPMDRWSRSIAESLAGPCGGHVLMPSEGPPWHPFQRWALRIDEGLQTSPLLLHMHPRYGLWHAWRFALALPRITPADTATLMTIGPSAPVDICSRCDGQPCLSSCPVQAFTRSGFDAGPCHAHLSSEQGADCVTAGCRARRACPVGMDHRYGATQAAFHMAAFARRSGRGAAIAG